MPPLEIPIEHEIKVINPPEGPKTLGWVVYEHILEETPSPEAYRMDETDEADKYFSHHAVDYKPSKEIAWTTIPVLEFLNDSPWNNRALNFVHALRPSCIRVTKDAVTCDAMTWRVTVYLKEDNRTIERITQEVECGTIGCRFGFDLNFPNEPIRIPRHHINPKALEKIQLK